MKRETDGTVFWYLINLIQSSLTLVCCDAPNNHLAGMFHSQHGNPLNSNSQVGTGHWGKMVRGKLRNLKTNCLHFSGLSVSNSIDILREKLLVLMVLRNSPGEDTDIEVNS